jgi:hypothetical protein
MLCISWAAINGEDRAVIVFVKRTSQSQQLVAFGTSDEWDNSAESRNEAFSVCPTDNID